MKKEELVKRLKELNLSLKDFANIANVPYSTINNWGFKEIPVPKWVESFLIHYEKSKKYDYLVNEIFNNIKKLEK